MQKKGYIVPLVVLCLLAACQAESLYSRLRAHFVMDNVLQAPELRTACEANSEFCEVFMSGNSFVFQNHKTTTTLPRTAIQDYSGCIMGLAGFIIGKPNIPDDTPLVCYDAACPNCYQDRVVTKRMTLKDSYMAECPLCHRVYNLDDHGYVYKIPAGQDSLPEHNRRLIRYRVYYYPSKYQLVVSN